MLFGGSEATARRCGVEATMREAKPPGPELVEFGSKGCSVRPAHAHRPGIKIVLKPQAKVAKATLPEACDHTDRRIKYVNRGIPGPEGTSDIGTGGPHVSNYEVHGPLNPKP